jgi:hypothetical protein
VHLNVLGGADAHSSDDSATGSELRVTFLPWNFSVTAFCTDEAVMFFQLLVGMFSSLARENQGSMHPQPIGEYPANPPARAIDMVVALKADTDFIGYFMLALRG